ncbi:MAG: 3-phosphoshikimate 1-carboxyvinyltransferase [Clostridiales bacterium]|nr:3-phosphoshikimate 1-carboxyvinyltransferase [Candidatus Crickella caballi]
MLSVELKKLKGTIDVPLSKSLAHRYLICAYIAGDFAAIKEFAEKFEASEDAGYRLCDDVKATLNSIRKLIEEERPVLNCGESGTTLRLLLPVAATMGKEAEFVAEGSLVGRPVKELTDELKKHGASIEYIEKGVCSDTYSEDDACSNVGNEITSDGSLRIRLSGKLEPGTYTIPGNISSQYISGLLLAFYAMGGQSKLNIEGNIESKSYVAMTEEVIRAYKDFKSVKGQCSSRTELECRILEGDWSAAAMWMAAGRLSGDEIVLRGLSENSLQGDSCFADILKKIYERDMVIDISDCPDLAPAIMLAALGTERRIGIAGAGRLRLKESDRLSTLASILRQLGAEVTEARDSLTVTGIGDRLLPGSDEPVDCCGDHRMVMFAALASIKCEKAVIIKDPECVSKSYPGFFEELKRLQQ